MRASDPPSVPLSFSNCFWGREEKGVDVLHDRMSEAKNICEELKAFYRERAAAEEDYAKKLLKISKMSLGTKECGTLKTSFVSVKTELEAMGNAHAEVAAGMRRELEEALASFANTVRERRKLVQTNIDRLRRTKAAQEQQVQKLKEKYEADCIKINGFIAQQNMLMGKELDKNNSKLEKSQMSVQTSNKDYQAAVKILRETTHRWNTDWKQACDKYQDLEEERIDFLKANLWTYANIMSTVCVSDDEACEKIRVNLEKCEVDEVIQSFVQAKSTGQEIPDAPRYKNFYRQEEHDDEVAYKVAQFSRDSNPQYRSSTPQYQPSDDELPVLPTLGRRHEERPMTGMSRHEDRPMTGISRHEERPMTGMSRRDDSSPVRPGTGKPRLEDRPPTGYPRSLEDRPPTGYPRNVDERPTTGVSPTRSQVPGRGRPATMQSMHDESPPSSHRSRSRGGSQSPLKGIINEYPPEGITQFCRQDSGSLRHDRPTSSRHSSSSSILSASEAPTNSTSDASTFQLNSPTKGMGPPSPKVLQRRDRNSVDVPSSPGKKSSFWNFGSKSPKTNTPKATPPVSPMKSSKSAPSGMAISVPSLDIGGGGAGAQRRSPGNNSRRERSEEPIAAGASVMLNIGNNVLEVNNPDARSRTKYEEPIDTTDPLMAALEDLKMASKTPRMSSSPNKRSPIDTQPAESPIYNPHRPPSRQDVNMSSMRSSTSQTLCSSQQSQTPPSRGNTSQTPSRSTPPPTYDTRRNTLGAPPPAHSAAEMERTRRQYSTQIQQVLGTGPPRPATAQILPRSTSPRPMSRQSQYADDSYSGRPGSSMSMNRQDIPPRARSPAPQQRGQYPPQDLPPRSRSPAPGRPVSRQEMEYNTRPTSRQDYDRRQSVSPAPYQPAQRGMYVDEPLRRSPSPQPYPRAVSPAPVATRPRSSMAAGPGSNPFGISIDRFGNVVDANGRSASPQPSHPSTRQQYAYGSSHRHDIDGVLDSSSRYPSAQNMSPAHARARSKSQSDVRARGNYTEDGRLILFPALYDYTAAIPEECSFRKGDVVLVTKTQDDGWWFGEIAGTRPAHQGLVPSNFFKTMQQA